VEDKWPSVVQQQTIATACEHFRQPPPQGILAILDAAHVQAVMGFVNNHGIGLRQGEPFNSRHLTPTKKAAARWRARLFF
jgi:hypothetical protein